jgi:sugar lactone lactonase YvrE
MTTRDGQQRTTPRLSPHPTGQAVIEPYATGMVWGESPRWHNGALWLSDTQDSRLWTDDGGVWRSTTLDSPCNGLWFLPDDRLVGAMMHQRRVAEWDGTRWRDYADLTGLGAGPLGDVVGDAAGNLYVDDVGFDAVANQRPAPGRIVLVRPDRTVVVAADEVEFPNGLAIIEKGHTLIVAQTSAQRLTAFDIRTDGTLGRRRPYADLAELLGPQARPDGIWPAEDGVWVATTSGRAIARIGDGEVHEAISTAPLLPIACCLRQDGTLTATLADTGGISLLEAVRAKTVTTSAVLIDRVGRAERGRRSS